jgi:hypothetical protein
MERRAWNAGRKTFAWPGKSVHEIAARRSMIKFGEAVYRIETGTAVRHHAWVGPCSVSHSDVSINVYG